MEERVVIKHYREDIEKVAGDGKDSIFDIRYWMWENSMTGIKLKAGHLTTRVPASGTGNKRDEKDRKTSLAFNVFQGCAFYAVFCIKAMKNHSGLSV